MPVTGSAAGDYIYAGQLTFPQSFCILSVECIITKLLVLRWRGPCVFSTAFRASRSRLQLLLLYYSSTYHTNGAVAVVTLRAYPYEARSSAF